MIATVPMGMLTVPLCCLLLQHQARTGWNASLEHRFHTLEESYTEATALLQVHGPLIYDMQRQVRNLSMVVERVRRNPGCMINIVRTSPLLSAHEVLHPGQCCCTHSTPNPALTLTPKTTAGAKVTQGSTYTIDVPLEIYCTV